MKKNNYLVAHSHIMCIILNMKLSQSRFQQYLSKLGDRQASEALSISQRSAQAYRLGERAPKLNDIPLIIKLANGRLTYACFFESNCE